MAVKRPGNDRNKGEARGGYKIERMSMRMK